MAKTFSLNLDCDNAAFDDSDAPSEIARILRAIADQVENGMPRGRAYDVNGNRVGSYALDESEGD